MLQQLLLLWRSWNLTVMAIQHYHSQGCTALSATEYKLSKNPAINYNDQLTAVTLQLVGVTLILLQVL